MSQTDPNAKQPEGPAHAQGEVAEQVAQENKAQVAEVQGHPAEPLPETVQPKTDEQAAADAQRQPEPESMTGEAKAAADDPENQPGGEGEAAAKVDEAARQNELNEAAAREQERLEAERQAQAEADQDRQALLSEVNEIDERLNTLRQETQASIGALVDRQREIRGKLGLSVEDAPQRSEYEPADADRHPLERLKSLEEEVAKIKLSLRGIAH